MVNQNELIAAACRFGAHAAAPVTLAQLRFYPELRILCEMNKCGCYGTNWGCPPGCGDVQSLEKEVRSYQNGVVFQYVRQLEDSFDYEGMMAGNSAFHEIAGRIRLFLRERSSRFLVLGAGKCSLCDACTYPHAPCRRPDERNVSVEACGIDVSELCSLAGLSYLNGADTVTNTGLILY